MSHGNLFGDFVAHTATAQSMDWDVLIGAGKTARPEPRKAGAIDYFCRFHPTMTGRIAVSGE
jgi:plastocyanin